MRKPRKNYDEVNYWESMADGMVGLLLCVLLVVLLLVLYLVQIPEEIFKDMTFGNSYEQYTDADDGGGNHSYGKIDDSAGDTWENNADNNGGANGGGGASGGGGDTGDGDETHQYDDPESGAGSGDGTDKAAVFVQLVDGETGRTIKKSGVEFELYGQDSSLQVLSTYYPKKIDYSKYATDSTGVFYLPERIPLLTYSLHGLTSIAGYDLAGNTEFTLEQAYDWDNPYVVSVEVNPSKNIVRMELKDMEDGSAITGSRFQVVAAQNIITQDGTTRFKEGAVADVITLDENGYGESEPIYLGEYLLRQVNAPEYYGKITQDTAVTIESKETVGTPAITELAEKKTTAIVELKDALYDSVYIEGAEFDFLLGDGTVVEHVTTDAQGRIELTNLKKSTTYHLQQTSSVEAYQVDPADYSFTVTGEGLIDGITEKQITVKNRLIRVSIGVKDMVFRGQVSDINMALYDSDGNVVEVWNSTGLEKTLEGLAVGQYRVVMAGDEKNAQTITVEDKTDLQIYSFNRWTPADIGTLLALALFVVGFVVLLTRLLKRRREEKKEGAKE